MRDLAFGRESDSAATQLNDTLRANIKVNEVSKQALCGRDRLIIAILLYFRLCQKKLKTMRECSKTHPWVFPFSIDYIHLFHSRLVYFGLFHFGIYDHPPDMDKSVSSHDYRIFLRELREARKYSGLTQIDLATRLGETQSFVSKCERGERRLDVLELRAFCIAIGLPLSDFARKLEQALGSKSSRRRIRRN